MNDRITIPALNELNSHETRRNRVPNPRYTHPEIEANVPRETLRSWPWSSPRCSPPRNHVSSSSSSLSSTVSGLLPFNLANGLDSNAVSRFLESLSRAGGEGGGGPGLEKGNADESNEERGWKAIGSTRGHEGSPGSSDILMEART